MSAPAVVADFADAVVAGEPAAIAELCTRDVRMRAITPQGTSEDHGPTDVARRWVGWWSALDGLGRESMEVVEVEGRWRVTHRLAARYPRDGTEVPVVAEQHLFCSVGDDGVRRIDLVCSGFRPRRTASGA